MIKNRIFQETQIIKHGLLENQHFFHYFPIKTSPSKQGIFQPTMVYYDTGRFWRLFCRGCGLMGGDILGPTCATRSTARDAFVGPMAVSTLGNGAQAWRGSSEPQRAWFVNGGNPFPLVYIYIYILYIYVYVYSVYIYIVCIYIYSIYIYIVYIYILDCEQEPCCELSSSHSLLLASIVGHYLVITWRFIWKWGYPKSSMWIGMFHCKPSIKWGYPIFRTPKMNRST